MHQPAVANGRQHGWEADLVSENGRAQIAFLNRNCLTGTKNDLLKCAAIFPQSNFAFSAAIKVVEHRLRYALLGDAAKVCDIDYAGRRKAAHVCLIFQHEGICEQSSYRIAEIVANRRAADLT
jgi:hypothetical protein